jgi:hypothetical protein
VRSICQNFVPRINRLIHRRRLGCFGDDTDATVVIGFDATDLDASGASGADGATNISFAKPTWAKSHGNSPLKDVPNSS